MSKKRLTDSIRSRSRSVKSEILLATSFIQIYITGRHCWRRKRRKSRSTYPSKGKFGIFGGDFTLWPPRREIDSEASKTSRPIGVSCVLTSNRVPFPSAETGIPLISRSVRGSFPRLLTDRFLRENPFAHVLIHFLHMHSNFLLEEIPVPTAILIPLKYRKFSIYRPSLHFLIIRPWQCGSHLPI